ncbi:MAG: hypothetical protein WAW07_03740 [Bacteroidales bacterium]
MKRIMVMLALLTGFMALAAQKVYSVEYPNQAGWKEKKKMHLMF